MAVETESIQFMQLCQRQRYKKNKKKQKNLKKDKVQILEYWNNNHW